MATQTFRLLGALSLSPVLGASSGVPGVTTPLDEVLQVDQLQQGALLLEADAPVSVALGTMTEVNVLFVKSTAKVRVRITSADGTQQAIPVDSVLLLTAESVGITAVDVMRVTGQDTTVDVLIGQVAS